MPKKSVIKKIVANISIHDTLLHIEEHEFYCKEFKKRIFPHFNDDVIKKEANDEEKYKLAELANLFDPEKHDPDEFNENITTQASEFASEHYCLITDMKQNIYLAGLAGMYHQWEKGLRDCILNFLPVRSDEIEKIIWGKKNFEMFDILTDAGWDIKQEFFYSNLDICRLLVNIYKHGEGTSLKDLETEYPKRYLEFNAEDTFPTQHLHYKYVSITDEHFDEFADAILHFWKNFPNQLTFSLPVPVS